MPAWKMIAASVLLVCCFGLAGCTPQDGAAPENGAEAPAPGPAPTGTTEVE